MRTSAQRRQEFGPSPILSFPHANDRMNHQRLLLATRAGRLGIWDYDIARDLITSDDRWLAIMGLPANQPTRSIAEYRAIIHPDDVQRATEVPKTASLLLAAGEDYSIEYRIVRPSGEVRWVRSVASIVYNERGEPIRSVGFVSDITEAHQAEERLAELNALLAQQNLELARLAMIDPLTGIANRRRFDQELPRACDEARRLRAPMALVMIDVDHFKAYNDHLGHAEGDRALRAVADVIGSAARHPYDLAARYGGEEFVLVLPDAGEVASVLRRIRDGLSSLALPHPASSAGAFLTLSCGCAIAREEEEFSPATLIARSDEALYRAKLAGRDRIVFAA